jgi:peroxiredoxin
MFERLFSMRSGLALGFCLFAGAAGATLAVGDTAPDFSLPAALGGNPFRFSLSDALKRGPVVVYFYPKSFTRGCTIEAHEFAEAAADFAAAGASLIGISADPLATQLEFSSKECRDKFPVAADPGHGVIEAYDSLRTGAPGGIADRISYVIAPDGKVAFVYSDRLPDKHIEGTLAVVRRLRTGHGAPPHP